MGDSAARWFILQFTLNPGEKTLNRLYLRSQFGFILQVHQSLSDGLHQLLFLAVAHWHDLYRLEEGVNLLVTDP